MRLLPANLLGLDSVRADAPRGARAQQRLWRALQTFNLLRLALGLALCGFAGLMLRRGNVDSQTSTFLILAASYVLFALVFWALARWRATHFYRQLCAQVLIDLALITFLVELFGGLNGGLTLLYFLPIAGGAILAPRLLAWFFAACATLIVLSFGGLNEINQGEAALRQLGLYGVAFFALAIALNELALRVMRQENLAAQRSAQLRSQQEINQQIIDTLVDGVVVASQRGRIITANPAAQKLLGGLAPQATHLPTSFSEQLAAWQRLACPIDFVAHVEWDAQNTHHTHHLESAADSSVQTQSQNTGFVLQRQNAMNLRFYAVPDTTRVVIFIEEQRRVEAAAQQVKLAAMGRLVAGIAHEIRNPLAAISHANELMMDAAKPATEQRLHAIVADNVARLNRMVEDVLGLAKPAPAAAAPIALAEQIGAHVAHFALARQISPDLFALQFNTTARIQFALGPLQQILDNLLANALRYASGKAGCIQINLGEFEGTLELAVSDDGAPIKPEIVRHLFEPFFTSTSKGTGLGLYLARELALAQGAQLSYVPPDERQKGAFILQCRAMN